MGEEAGSVAVGPRERPRPMAEEFDFDQSLGDGPAMQGHEGTLPSRLDVHRAREEFLASAALPFDQDRNHARREAPDLGDQLRELARAGEELVEDDRGDGGAGSISAWRRGFRTSAGSGRPHPRPDDPFEVATVAALRLDAERDREQVSHHMPLGVVDRRLVDDAEPTVEVEARGRVHPRDRNHQDRAAAHLAFALGLGSEASVGSRVGKEARCLLSRGAHHREVGDAPLAVGDRLTVGVATPPDAVAAARTLREEDPPLGTGSGKTPGEEGREEVGEAPSTTPVGESTGENGKNRGGVSSHPAALRWSRSGSSHPARTPGDDR